MGRTQLPYLLSTAWPPSPGFISSWCKILLDISSVPGCPISSPIYPIKLDTPVLGHLFLASKQHHGNQCHHLINRLCERLTNKSKSIGIIYTARRRLYRLHGPNCNKATDLKAVYPLKSRQSRRKKMVRNWECVG